MTIKETLLNAIAAQVDRRRESQQLSGDDRHQSHLGIRAHRFDLRHLYLAYALERGKPYAKLEQRCHLTPSADRIVAIINDDEINKKWQTGIALSQVKDWLEHRDIKPENVEVPRVEAALAHAS